jgi:hypothetical protein
MLNKIHDRMFIVIFYIGIKHLNPENLMHKILKKQYESN